MTQPEDPIAFSRFTEGLVASGDPDYDPAAMLAVEQNAVKMPEPEEASTGRPVREEAEEKSEQNSVSYHYDSPGAVRSPDYADYSQNSIVSVTESTENTGIPQEQIDDNWEEDWDDLSYSGYFPDDEDSPERSNYLVWERGGRVGKPEIREPVAQPVLPSVLQNEEPAELASLSGGTESGAGEFGDEGDDDLGKMEDPLPVDAQRAELAEAPPGDPWENAWREDENSQTPLMAEAQSSARSSGNESIAEARIVIRQPEPVAQAPVQNVPGTVEYILVPAEKRPPAPGPEPEIRGPEVDPLGPPAAGQERQEQIDESLFIDPIEKTRRDQAQVAEEAARAAEAVRLAEERRVAEEAARAAAMERPEVTVLLPREGGEPGGPWVDPVAELPPLPPERTKILVQTPEETGEPQGPWVNPIEFPVREPVEPPPLELTLITDPPQPSPQSAETQGAFSVPVNVITELEKGKYYVQLGAFRNITSVESVLLSIDPGYPLNVQNSGSTERPMYRLLIGPVNLGESGALVQRFKGSGYRDAYIRTN
jgi:hypothetical protein